MRLLPHPGRGPAAASVYALVLCALAALALLAPQQSRTALAAQVLDRVVAVVNGEIITMFDLDQRVTPFVERMGAEVDQLTQDQMAEVRNHLLEAMVHEILMRQEIDRLQIEVTDVEVENRVRQVRERLGLTESEFLKKLRLEGLTYDRYKDDVRMEILRHRLIGVKVRRMVVVTQDEIEAYYEANKGDYVQERAVRLGLIVLPAGEAGQADMVREKIRSGEMSFAEAAAAYSVGPGAGNGGDIGFLDWKDLSTEWRDALRGRQVGELSGIFSLEGADAFLLLKEDDGGDLRPLEAVRDEIQQKLQQPKYEERYKEYMGQLEQNAVIDIRL